MTKLVNVTYFATGYRDRGAPRKRYKDSYPLSTAPEGLPSRREEGKRLRKESIDDGPDLQLQPLWQGMHANLPAADADHPFLKSSFAKVNRERE